MSVDERPHCSAGPTPRKRHHNSLPRTSLEAALGYLPHPRPPLKRKGNKPLSVGIAATPTPLKGHREEFPTLEGVMNFDSETIAFWHGDSKTIPKRRFRRRVGLCRSLSGPRSRRRASAQPRVARGLQWAQMDSQNRLCVALYATRSSTVGSRLPADEEVARSGRLRGDGPRFTLAVAPFGRQGVRTHGSHTRLSHLAVYSREWLSGRLRWSEAQEGLEGACGGGHFRTPARLVPQPGQRAGASLGGRVGRGCARGGHGRVGGASVRGSGLLWGAPSRRSGGSWHQLGGGQVSGGEARLRALAEKVGRRA